mmetsp:Transcript_2367/g.3506  ORF Transcript_2367/g.3506 Transcript_2367/m.3506 type:complete len:442 (+) Transcript_2367:162-1487(+)|eukprot:CAMPEP_0195511610 /NCGR_PEP_ID=MMETSP0794_2-20130614/3876_1 /TAXON_ID=515487 /ORGANISM="Stephanopyxis turris, Strain CCMP 815" /LENGTH=441 /DNA_ID=CAMNT_0040639253 /DNA_START=123 /DNA_END=1448 /DNA_ORIENTATION=-
MRRRATASSKQNEFGLPSIDTRHGTTTNYSKNNSKNNSKMDGYQQGILVFFLVALLIILVKEKGTSLKEAIRSKLPVRQEPFPTTSQLSATLQRWTKEAHAAGFAAKTEKVPHPGPIPQTIWLSECSNRYTINQDKCKINQENSIRLYKEAWGNPNADVQYLTRDHCISLIDHVEPRLVEPYKHEHSDVSKSEICRVAALYLYGGYYLDVEIETVTPVVPASKTVSFITAIEEPGTGFFQAIMASTHHHLILEHVLEKKVSYYERVFVYVSPDPEAVKRKAEREEKRAKREQEAAADEGGDKDTQKERERNLHPDDDRIIYDDFYGDDFGHYDDGFSGNNREEGYGYIDPDKVKELQGKDSGWRMGTRTLKEAFAILPESARGETLILQEIELSGERKTSWYPNVERRVSPDDKCCCNFVVHDPRTRVVHFYSRFVGTTFC